MWFWNLLVMRRLLLHFLDVLVQENCYGGMYWNGVGKVWMER